MVPGHVQALQDMFCAPTVHPIALTNHTIGANIIMNLSLYIPRLKCSKMLAHIVGFVGAVGCTVGAQTCPVVHGHTLIPFASATSCKVCCKKAFNASKIAHFMKYPFFLDSISKWARRIWL